MKSLDIEFLNRQSIPLEMGGLLGRIGEYKGRQDLIERQTPQVLETLKTASIIESTESSNRIEGVTLPSKRFRDLMSHPSKPKSRSEAEILGYRQALSKIHKQYQSIPVEEKTILDLHRQIYTHTDVPSGQYKKLDNTIEQRLSDGRIVTRFVPVSARQTPSYIKELCIRFHRLMDNHRASPLIIIPAFIFDFLCIHPFRDGNGRVSRLLTVLLLHQSGYTVGKFISIERLIEESKETYYEALLLSSKGWHHGRHNLIPWLEFSLGIILGAYLELERRVGSLTKTKGAKTRIVKDTIENLPYSFSISDVEALCPSVSRDMIRVVLNRLRKQGHLRSTGTGRGALWEKRGNIPLKRGNKHSNNLP